MVRAFAILTWFSLVRKTDSERSRGQRQSSILYLYIKTVTASGRVLIFQPVLASLPNTQACAYDNDTVKRERERERERERDIDRDRDRETERQRQTDRQTDRDRDRDRDRQTDRETDRDRDRDRDRQTDRNRWDHNNYRETEAEARSSGPLTPPSSPTPDGQVTGQNTSRAVTCSIIGTHVRCLFHTRD